METVAQNRQNRMGLVAAYYEHIGDYDHSTDIALQLGYKEVVSKKVFRHDTMLNESSFIIDCLFIRVSARLENIQFSRLVHCDVSFHDNLTAYHCEFVNCRMKLRQTEAGVSTYQDCAFVSCTFSWIGQRSTRFIGCKFVDCDGLDDEMTEGNLVEV